MDTKLKNSKTLTTFKILCFFGALLFAFLAGDQAIISARANILYHSKNNKPYETIAFLQNLDYDLSSLLTVNGYYEDNGFYSDFNSFCENSVSAKTITSEINYDKEAALELYDLTIKIKELCPGDVKEYFETDGDNYYSDYYDSSHITEEAEKTDTNDYVCFTVPEIYSSTGTNDYVCLTVPESYSSFEEWARDYATIRNCLFEYVSDATSKETIEAEFEQKLTLALENSYNSYSYTTRYNTIHLDSLKNFKYLLINENGTKLSNLEKFNINEKEFINGLETDSMFYVRFEKGMLLSPPALYDNESNILNFIFKSGITSIHEFTEEYFYKYFGDNTKLYIKIDANPTGDDAYKMISETFYYSLNKSDSYHTYIALVSAIISLLSLVAYGVLIGMKTEKPVKLNPFERIPLIIYLLLYIVFFCLAVTALTFTSLADVFIGTFDITALAYIFTPRIVNVFTGIIVATISLATLLFTLYIARNKKAEALERRFIIGLVILGLHKLSKKKKALWDSLKYTKRTSLCFMLFYFAVNFVIISFALASDYYAVLFLFAFIIYNAAALTYAAKYMGDCLKLASFAEEIRKGNYALNVDISSFVKPLRKFATDLCACRDSVKRSVDEGIKGERMKTELITNVSHDLKTPLTSIINYVSLLKLDNISEEDKKEYLDILEKKSKKLQRLIEDLTEASKATSGNMKITLERVNLNELAVQAVGENSDSLEEAGLDLIFGERDKDLFVSCNTQNTFRVIDNLFSNVKKYSLGGSRVYAEVYREGSYGVFMLKNVSKDKLNVAPDELTARFVRGDKSRTTEGSGLGLSIARSFTEMQGGAFEIVIDGDLFKAMVKLPLDDSCEKKDDESAFNTSYDSPPNGTSKSPDASSPPPFPTSPTV